MTKYWTALVTASLATLLAILAPTATARADIFQWEYINPANPALGKQPSTTLAPDGAGAFAVPGANLLYRNLTKAYLIGANLTGAAATRVNFTNADLSYSNLSNADFHPDDYGVSNLTGANLSHANLTGADFSGYEGTGQEGEIYFYIGADLTGANLSGANLTNTELFTANLTNANLSQTNLTNLGLSGVTLTGANLSGADVAGTSFGRRLVHQPYYSLFGGITVAQLYSTASYQAHDLTGIGLGGNDLTGANLAGQNLTNAWFYQATLTGADLTGANIRTANFNREFAAYSGYIGGITLAQLYSTATYQAHDLTGIGLARNDLTGGNFIGQNLINASFARATLTDANLTGAEVRGANFSRLDDYGSVYGSGITVAQLYSTASYQAHDLSGIKLGFNNLAGVNLADQNLNNADFASATLTNADLSQANLTNAYFSSFYHSTAANLTGANLSRANLANADFSAGHDYYDHFVGANLTVANLSQANLANADFSGLSYSVYDEWGEYLGEEILLGGNLTGANLSGADARGANFQYTTLTGANTSNLIQSDGHIAGLDLTAGASLVVRNYDGDPAASPPTGPLPIVVDQHLTMDATGALRLVVDADAWGSTISFAPGIPVTRGGTLDLTFAPGVDVATQSGRTIDLFDWTGVTPTGAFTVSSPYTWNLSNLYTTGEVTLTAAAGAVLGDFNGDSVVDADDLGSWKTGFGVTGNATLSQGDADDDQDVDGADFLAWQRQLGVPTIVAATEAVPEPGTLLLINSGALAMFLRRRMAVS